MKKIALFNKHALVLATVALFINGTVFYFYGGGNVLSGILASHGEIAYNVANYNSVKINKKRLADVTHRQQYEERRIEYAEIDHTAYGKPDGYRSIYDTIGYGVVLGLLWKLTGSLRYRDIQILQILLFSFLLLLFYQVAFFLFHDLRTTFLATVMLISFLPLSLLNIVALRDVWAFYGMVLLLYAVLGFLYHQFSLALFVVLTILVGLVELVRPTLFAPVCMMIFVLIGVGIIQRKVLYKTLMAAGCLIATNVLFFWLPFTIHNKMAYDRYFIGPTGIGLWQLLGTVKGNPCRQHNGDHHYAAYMMRNFGLRSGTQECENKARALFLKAISEYPAFYARIVLQRIPMFLFPEWEFLPPFYQTYTIGYPTVWARVKRQLRSYGGLVDLFVHRFFFLVYLLLAYAGVLCALLKKRYQLFFFVFVATIAPSAKFILSLFEYRSLVPFFAFYSLFVGYVLVFFHDAWKLKFLDRIIRR